VEYIHKGDIGIGRNGYKQQRQVVRYTGYTRVVLTLSWSLPGCSLVPRHSIGSLLHQMLRSNVAMGGTPISKTRRPWDRAPLETPHLLVRLTSQPVLFAFAKPSDWNAARKAVPKRSLFVVSNYENFSHPISSFETWK